MLILGEQHLRAVLTEYARHYNHRRPHRGQNLDPPDADQYVPAEPAARISHQRVLGGLINEYQPAA
jgi:putative transposase